MMQVNVELVHNFNMANIPMKLQHDKVIHDKLLCIQITLRCNLLPDAHRSSLATHHLPAANDNTPPF